MNKRPLQLAFTPNKLALVRYNFNSSIFGIIAMLGFVTVPKGFFNSPAFAELILNRLLSFTFDVYL